MHIIRNSIDHGIESPEKRIQKGKSSQGKIQFFVELENQYVVIKISDDGAGLNLIRLRQKAVESGIVTDPSQLTDEATTNMIFYSGISTAEKVSDISGRGVGMDAVKRFLQDKGGDVSIVLEDQGNEIGRRFSLELKLPSTFTIQI
ncbi:MAG: hypothetical protein HQM12_22215 [SAR324 cluster bacterium]|nr:hypothetical protein [SAR324 cluster bacterium]